MIGIKRKGILLSSILIIFALYSALADVPGSLPAASSYASEGLSYEDDTISFSITQGRAYERATQ